MCAEFVKSLGVHGNEQTGDAEKAVEELFALCIERGRPRDDRGTRAGAGGRVMGG